MNSKLIVLALLCIISTVTSNPSDVLGYYWKEYKGKIPIDAFPGGVDKAGNLTYIGQLYTKDYELMPVTIVKGSNVTFGAANGKVIQSDKDIKILCSVEQHKFKWTTPEIAEAHLLTNDCPLVNGGKNANEIVNIGHVNYEGETIIGRAFISSKVQKGLWIPYNEKEVHLTSYEILTFDCMK